MAIKTLGTYHCSKVLGLPERSWKENQTVHLGSEGTPFQQLSVDVQRGNAIAVMGEAGGSSG